MKGINKHMRGINIQVLIKQSPQEETLRVLLQRSFWVCVPCPPGKVCFNSDVHLAFTATDGIRTDSMSRILNLPRLGTPVKRGPPGYYSYNRYQKRTIFTGCPSSLVVDSRFRPCCLYQATALLLFLNSSSICKTVIPSSRVRGRSEEGASYTFSPAF